MTRYIFISALLLFSSAFAQSLPDFSGVFLRTAAKNQVLDFVDKEPLVLEVRQFAEKLEVKVIQNGADAVMGYHLNGAANGMSLWGVAATARARLKEGKLLIESVVQERSALPSGANDLRIKEGWELSPDRQTLTLKRSYEFQHATQYNFSETETYIRRASLGAALQDAAAASVYKCIDNRPPPRGPKSLSYDEGGGLGGTDFQRLREYLLFSATLSAESFKGLQRVRVEKRVEYRRNGHLVLEYPEFVILEIEPMYSNSKPWITSTQPVVPISIGGPSKNPIPSEFLHLRFRLKWTGSTERDLGEIQSKLITEAWPELREPAKFYRLQVPAKGVLLTDSLQVRILSDVGQQIACFSGQL